MAENKNENTKENETADSIALVEEIDETAFAKQVEKAVGEVDDTPIINKEQLEKKTGLNKTSLILFALAAVLIIIAVVVYATGGKNDTNDYLTLLQGQTPADYPNSEFTYKTGFESYFRDFAWKNDSENQKVSFTGKVEMGDDSKGELSTVVITFACQISNGTFTSSFDSMTVNGEACNVKTYLTLEKAVFDRKTTSDKTSTDIDSSDDASDYLALFKKQVPSDYPDSVFTYQTGFENYFTNFDWSIDENSKVITFKGNTETNNNTSGETSEVEISFTFSIENNKFTSDFASLKIDGEICDEELYAELVTAIFDTSATSTVALGEVSNAA